MQIDGIGIARYTIDGPDDRPPLVLLHGLGHWTEAAWDPVVPRLARERRIVAIDLPGFGESDRPDVAYDLPFFRRIVTALVDELGTATVALAGHSLGGLIAADVAAAAPARIERLALLAPAGFLDVPRWLVRILGSRAVRFFFSLRPARGFVAKTLRDAVADGAHIDDATVARAYAYALDPALRRAFGGVYAGAMQAMADLPGLHRRLATYDGPVFLGWGPHDRYIPIRALANAQRVYPRAEAHVFEESGHLIALDEPVALADALATFVSRTGV